MAAAVAAVQARQALLVVETHLQLMPQVMVVLVLFQQPMELLMQAAVAAVRKILVLEVLAVQVVAALVVIM
jgi:hypothetical protein